MTSTYGPVPGGRPDRQGMAEAMSDASAVFARHGDSGHPRIPEWDTCTAESRVTMVLDIPGRMEIDPARE